MAGGRVSDYKAASYSVSTGRILATGPALHDHLQAELDTTHPLPEHLYAS